MTREKDILREVMRFAIDHGYEKDHSNQVTSLSMLLFDLTMPLHGLDKKIRVLLESAALLHDIGRTGSGDRHHKEARDIIMRREELPFTDGERKIVALVARYHRQTLPESDHAIYSELPGEAREIVDKLSAILRIADGLDRGHDNSVWGITCDILKDEVIFHILADGLSEVDRDGALWKSDLFEKVFKRKVVVEWF
ncbi:MAG: HD domain-containing protein [Candidatus Omnitrophica bacterium]|nr:HD domain-containing protein [Candidatus Omnitrophota bacterium]